jgi:uncharacterized hydrophobic protein (TIGR00271 family)
VHHVRVIVPEGRTEAVCTALADHPGVTNVVVLPDAAREPRGDLVMADIAREAVNEVLTELRRLGVDHDGSIAMERVDLSLSDVAEAAEQRAPGHGDDAVVWEELGRRTSADARLTWTFVTFLALATQLAGIAALIDSPILVVGAMVLGPEFGTVAAISYGLLIGDLKRIRTATRTLCLGFLVAVAVTFACALVSRWIGVIEVGEPARLRPMTGFIYNPDRWSFIVALLAGAAGVLSLTADKSSALVGVFISVTTVPAAGNIAVALALEHWHEVRGSFLQLAVNVAGMVIAGFLTLVVQKALWGIAAKREEPTSSG